MKTLIPMLSRGLSAALVLAVCLPGEALHGASVSERLDELARGTAAGTLTLDQVIEIEELLGSDTWRADKLALSPRVREDVVLTVEGRRIGAMVAYPEGTEPSAVVIMVPEDQGLNRWGRLMADEIAAMGYIVIAPDFHFGLAPNGGGGSDYPDVRTVFMTHRAQPRDEAPKTAALNAWADYGKHLARSNGKLAIVGFAWGGGRAVRFATQRDDLSAVFVFYDVAPPAEELARLTAPLYGFYAEHDPRVTRSLAATREAMDRLGKPYQSVVYSGSEHMFVRLGEEPRNWNPANTPARHQALARLQELLAIL